MLRDDTTVALAGFTVMGVAEEIYKAVETRYLATGHPRALTLVHSAGQSDRVRGMPRWAHEGLLNCIIGSHWGLAPRMAEFIAANKVAAFCLPQGQIAQMYRAVAGGKPGCISQIGLRTFVDPRVDGGRMNDLARARADVVELISLGGQDYLWYKPLRFDTALLRGTTADDDGNVSCEEEAISLEILSMAQAVKQCGGTVIVQVKRRVASGMIPPRHVAIPGILVDVVVVAQDIEDNHRQTSGAVFNPAYISRAPVATVASPPLALDERTLIGRRAALELRPGAIVNLGTGIPGDAVGPVAVSEGLLPHIKLTIESGTIGGIPVGGVDFGLAIGPDAIIEHPYQFDFYNGGGVDIAYMGVGEIDRWGNVNVSKLAGRTPGCGGFIDITQPAKTVVFCATFTSGGLKVGVHDGSLTIVKEGRFPKFVDAVTQVTFSAAMAIERGQRVLYVLERAVFDVTPEGIRLIEVAPGVHVEQEVLARMPFRPIVRQPLTEMPAVLFREGPMGLLEQWTRKDE